MHIKSLNARVEKILNSDNRYSRMSKDGHITASGLVIKDEKVSAYLTQTKNFIFFDLIHYEPVASPLPDFCPPGFPAS